MAKRRAGLEPLAYMGVNPSTPPQMIHRTIPPTANNDENVDIGTFWIVTNTDAIYVLTSLAAGVATWTEITGDLVAGDLPIIVTGGGGAQTISLSNGTDGQLLIGGGAVAAWANLTSSGGTVAIAETPNGINLEATGVAGLTQLDGDTGSATPVAGIIIIAGGTNVTTSAAGQTVTINMDDPITIADIDITNVLTLSGLSLGVLVSDSGGTISSINGTDGQLMIAGTGIDPIWADLTSTGSTITITGGANTLNIETAQGQSSPYLIVDDAFSGVETSPTGITYKSPYWVLCTDRGGGASPGGRVYSSTDFSSWTLRASTTSSSERLKDVHGGDDSYWVAVSDTNFTWTATNPTGAWTKRNTATSTLNTKVSQGSGYWVMLGKSYPTPTTFRVTYNTDPTTFWTTKTDSASEFNDLVYNGSNLWVVVGNNGTLITFSDPTVAHSTPTSSFGTTSINAVAYGSSLGMFCAVGDDGKVATSTDGVTWTQRINTFSRTDSINSITFDTDLNMFVAASNYSMSMSYDGINWFHGYKSGLSIVDSIYADSTLVIVRGLHYLTDAL